MSRPRGKKLGLQAMHASMDVNHHSQTQTNLWRGSFGQQSPDPTQEGYPLENFRDWLVYVYVLQEQRCFIAAIEVILDQLGDPAPSSPTTRSLSFL